MSLLLVIIIIIIIISMKPRARDPEFSIILTVFFFSTLGVCFYGTINSCGLNLALLTLVSCCSVLVGDCFVW